MGAVRGLTERMTKVTKPRERARLACSVAVMALTACLASCGGGGGGTEPPVTTSNGGGSTTGSGPPPPATPIPVAYVTGDGANEIAALAIDGNSGALSMVSGSPFPSDPSDYAIAIDPKDLFAYYVSSEGSYIRGYSIDASTGALAKLSGGPYFTGGTPTAIAIDPSGTLLFTANGASDNFSVFSINQDGSLTQITGSPFPAGS